MVSTGSGTYGLVLIFLSGSPYNYYPTVLKQISSVNHTLPAAKFKTEKLRMKKLVLLTNLPGKF